MSRREFVYGVASAAIASAAPLTEKLFADSPDYTLGQKKGRKADPGPDNEDLKRIYSRAQKHGILSFSFKLEDGTDAMAYFNKGLKNYVVIEYEFREKDAGDAPTGPAYLMKFVKNGEKNFGKDNDSVWDGKRGKWFKSDVSPENYQELDVEYVSKFTAALKRLDETMSSAKPAQ